VFAARGAFARIPIKKAFRIIEKIKVGVTPGIDFGSEGEGFCAFLMPILWKTLKKDEPTRKISS